MGALLLLVNVALPMCIVIWLNRKSGRNNGSAAYWMNVYSWMLLLPVMVASRFSAEP